MDDPTDMYLGIGFGCLIIVCLLCVMGTAVREYCQDLDPQVEELLNADEIV